MDQLKKSQTQVKAKLLYPHNTTGSTYISNCIPGAP